MLLLLAGARVMLPDLARVATVSVSIVPTVRLSRTQALVGTAVAVGVLTFGFRVLAFSGFPNDQLMHVALAQQTLMGDVPVRDFQDPGMPLTYLASAAALHLGGGSLLSELVLSSAALGMAAGLTVVAGAALTNSVWLGLAMAGVEVAAVPRLYSYPKILLYVAGALLLLRLVREPSGHRIAATAALTAVAFLFRHDHGAYLGIMFAAALIMT